MTWRYTFILAAGIVFIVTGLWATAAPIGPRSEKLSDEILSLGGLKQIQLEVEQIPAPLNEAGLEQQTVDNLIQQSLKEGGFVIMKDEDVPRLLVRVQAVTNSDDPGGLGALVIVAVHQKGDGRAAGDSAQGADHDGVLRRLHGEAGHREAGRKETSRSAGPLRSAGS